MFPANFQPAFSLPHSHVRPHQFKSEHVGPSGYLRAWRDTASPKVCIISECNRTHLVPDCFNYRTFPSCGSGRMKMNAGYLLWYHLMTLFINIIPITRSPWPNNPHLTRRAGWKAVNIQCCGKHDLLCNNHRLLGVLYDPIPSTRRKNVKLRDLPPEK